MKLWALIIQTFYELKAKATLAVLAGISTLIILFLLVSLSSVETADGVRVVIFGNPITPALPPEKLSDVVLQLQAGLANGLYAGLVLFGVFATASIIPDALEKGSVDLYLSKPLPRWELLIGKYLGAIAVVLINVVYFIGALWLIFGIRLGVWNVQLLLSAFTLTFVYGCLYSIVVYFGVVSRNTAISIIGAFLYLFVVSNALYHRKEFLYLASSNQLYRGVLDGLYYILPQLSPISDSIQRQITNQKIDAMPFVQSFLSSTVIFLGSVAILRKKDF